MKFLHAADLHLDAQLKGLEAYAGAPVREIRDATRQAFENLIALAISERVDFVIIAGDLFDGRWTDTQTGLWTAGGFRRLEREGIPVFLLRGNHDAESEAPRQMAWPANVREFPSDRPATFFIEQVGVALHGQSYSTRASTDNLARTYPAPSPGCFNIGVLHTSLQGSSQHTTYAPASIDDLVSKAYDYWALGHVHQRKTLRESPYIAWSGCTQGRHINEPGAKGCFIATAERGQVRVTFHELDVLRWETIVVDLPPEADVVEALDLTRSRLHEAVSAADGRLLATRVVLRGATACHQEFNQPGRMEQLELQVRDAANHVGRVWVEQVVCETRPAVDLELLRSGQDLLGELLRDLATMQTASPEDLRQLGECLKPLAGKANPELQAAEIRLDDPEQIRSWLASAEGLLTGMFGSGESPRLRDESRASR